MNYSIQELVGCLDSGRSWPGAGKQDVGRSWAGTRGQEEAVQKLECRKKLARAGPKEGAGKELGLT